MKRSNETIFWSIFGAGGMLVAIFLPILMVLSFFITSVSGAEQLTSEFRTIDTAFAWFVYSGFGAFICFLTISGCVWHALHRVYHGMHDLTIHVNFAHQLICYGLAFIISLIALVACAIRMFS